MINVGEIERLILAGNNIQETRILLGISKGTYDNYLSKEERKRLSNLSREINKNKLTYKYYSRNNDNFILNAY